MRRVEKVNAIALGVIIWIVLILSALQLTGFNLDFYVEQYASRDTAEEIGVSSQDLMIATEVLLDYTSGKREDMIVEVEVNGTVQPFFNQKEIHHMLDVRILYLNVIQLRNILLIFALINIFALIAFNRKSTISILQFGLKWVSIGLGSIIVALAAFAIIDFDAFWTAFHKVLFTNDLWLLDPYTDNLINMVPERFFIDLILMIAVHFTLAMLTLFTLLQGIKDKGINQNMLKVIAVITMTIDHVGYFLFPEIRELRIIGRIAYPIFTYLFAISYRFSHDRKALLIRLSIFAILGHGLIYAAGQRGFYNILFLFILGWFAFWIIDQKKDILLSIVGLGILATIAEMGGVDYGAYGIVTLVIFYVFHDQKLKQFGAFTLLTFLFSFQWLIVRLINDSTYWSNLPQIFSRGIYSLTGSFPQIFAVLALIPLALYIYKVPKNKTSLVYKANQYFYYAYYPIHFAILAYIHYHL
ncbi:MAG: Integral membrane protein [Erysipelotrichaceae bacterium]|nr:MAG: Integral membrane [Erysipelotrichaceae bacterium]TXT18252.1 MAG: Integral membrane protein [Erysipelotrichaceae bacterium]